jgi:GATA-binding protein, other eukaryote
MLTVIGLYYKLHGVHRPVAMKKSVIKRRKRVVPAPQGTQASEFDINNHSTGSPESDGGSSSNPAHDQRGSVNADGSINLGFRPRYEPRLLPAPVATPQLEGHQQLPSIGSAGKGPNQSNHHQDNSSMNNDNILPPMTSYPSPTPRPPSLSPNSFLSPNRKRSFTVADNEPAPSNSDSNSKRLSSIKSILNPSQQSSENSESLDPSLRFGRSPEMQYGQPPSPSSFGQNTGGTWDSPNMPRISRDLGSDSERTKIEKRAALQREAERMRELLRAKERELAELNE